MARRSPMRAWLADTVFNPRPPWYANGVIWRNVGITLLSLGFAMAMLNVSTTQTWLNIVVFTGSAGLLTTLIAVILYFLQQTQRTFYRDGLKALTSGKCHSCSYPVTGHNHARCPECGANIPAFIREARTELNELQAVNLDDLARRT